MVLRLLVGGCILESEVSEMTVANIICTVERIHRIRDLITNGVLHDKHFEEINQLLMSYEAELVKKKVVE